MTGALNLLEAPEVFVLSDRFVLIYIDPFEVNPTTHFHAGNNLMGLLRKNRQK